MHTVHASRYQRSAFSMARYPRHLRRRRPSLLFSLPRSVYTVDCRQLSAVRCSYFIWSSIILTIWPLHLEPVTHIAFACLIKLSDPAYLIVCFERNKFFLSQIPPHSHPHLSTCLVQVRLGYISVVIIMIVLFCMSPQCS